MNSLKIFGTLAVAAALSATLQSCKRENGIDNNNVLQVPYALYAADAQGAIVKTNDGEIFTSTLPGDGRPLRALATSKSNVLLVKDSLFFVSKDNGFSFLPFTIDKYKMVSNVYWQQFFLLNTKKDNRIYLPSFLSKYGANLVYTDDNGSGRYFDTDTLWKKASGDTARLFTSFTETDNGYVYAYSNSGSRTNGARRLYVKKAKDSSWEAVTTNLFPSPAIGFGGDSFYLAHIGNTVIAADYGARQGVLYSNDDGATFKKYTGVPNDVIIYDTRAAFDKVMLATTKGVYLYGDNNSFVLSNTGLDPKTTVYSIATKDNVYKNGVVKNFVFIATSTGIYRSEDKGLTWIKAKTGDYRIVY